jgi:hypothetical protein
MSVTQVDVSYHDQPPSFAAVRLSLASRSLTRSMDSTRFNQGAEGAVHENTVQLHESSIAQTRKPVVDLTIVATNR